MKPTDAFGDLLRLRQPIIETREVAVRLGLSISRASHLMSSLEESGLVLRLRRGLWALRPDVDPLVVPPYLTAPFPAYVSFWSALARHGMIQQVPRKVYVASLDRTRQIVTAIGTYSIHHLIPELFDGYMGSEAIGYLATAEKALFDSVYVLAARSGKIFLPEVELPDQFQKEKLDEWTNRVARLRLRTLVRRGLDKALTGTVTRANADRSLGRPVGPPFEDVPGVRPPGASTEEEHRPHSAAPDGHRIAEGDVDVGGVRTSEDDDVLLL